MRRSLVFLLFLACSAASAQVFRHIGPDGEVYFSDTPAPGSERVHLTPTQTVSLPPPANGAGRPEAVGTAGEKADPGAAYAQFTIVKPSNGQGVRANGGSVTVYLALQPALRPGHVIELAVDGEDGPRIKAGDTLNFNLHNMSRGSHTVSARVKDAAGRQLIETGPISFYVLRVAGGG